MLVLAAALRGALAAGWEKEGELATTSLEFEYLYRKSRCGMLIGGDDITNDVITLGTCFSMFVYISARFRFALIGGDLIAQSKGSHRGIEGGISNSRDVAPSFSSPAAKHPGEPARRLCWCTKKSLVLIELFSHVKTYFSQKRCITADHVSESDLLCGGLGIALCFINILCYVICWSHHLKRQETTTLLP